MHYASMSLIWRPSVSYWYWVVLPNASTVAMALPTVSYLVCVILTNAIPRNQVMMRRVI